MKNPSTVMGSSRGELFAQEMRQDRHLLHEVLYVYCAATPGKISGVFCCSMNHIKEPDKQMHGGG